MDRIFNKLILPTASLALMCWPALAQQTAPVAPPPAASPVAPTVNAPSRSDAPQINAVVHKINGLKMLNLLRRKGAKVAPLDDAQLIARDAYTSITAGFSLEDGVVVARLPQAEMEVVIPPAGFNAPANAPVAPGLYGGSANLFILQKDGQRFPAQFIGLDGGTGLSLLQVSGLKGNYLARDVREETLTVGQRVRVVAPARATQAEGLTSDQVFMSVNEMTGKLSEVERGAGGKLMRLTMSAEKLSPAIVGGFVLNEAGETIGMIESSSETEASLIPVAAVRRAVSRIRLSVKSKPQPWLGARGEAVAGATLENLMTVGWKKDEASRLMAQRSGVLLTSVPPQTPAGLADLRSGDVVMRVNAVEVKSAEDFSSMLKATAGRAPVRFTVMRPNRPAPQVVSVRLIPSLNPVLEMEAAEARAMRLQSADPLLVRGVETIAITPKLAAYLKARGGLLVTSVHPKTQASAAGLLAGDVIETLDGNLLTNPITLVTLPPQVTLGIVRDGRQIEVKLSSGKVK